MNKQSCKKCLKRHQLAFKAICNCPCHLQESKEEKKCSHNNIESNMCPEHCVDCGEVLVEEKCSECQFEKDHSQSCSKYEEYLGKEETKRCRFCGFTTTLMADKSCRQCGADTDGWDNLPQEPMEDCQVCGSYICKCPVKEFTTQEPMEWESEFDKEFSYIDDAYFTDSFYGGNTIDGTTDKLKDFIKSQIKQAEERGQKEARCHYYDLVRKEATKDERERIVKVVENYIPKSCKDKEDILISLTCNDIINLINQNNE